MKRVLLTVVFIGLFALPTHAQFDISWHAIAGGAGVSTGGTFELGGTIGQPGGQTDPPMTGGSFELSGGFWPVAQTCYCPGDLNGDGKKDGGDIQQFVGCVLAGGAGNCSCADVDETGGTNSSDVSVFVTDLLSGAACQ
jgi:hypothetical protein